MGCLYVIMIQRSVVFLYYWTVLVGFTFSNLPFIHIHSVNLTAAFHNRRWSFYYIIMPAWTKQHLILYFPELNTRMNLSSRNMVQIFYSTNTKAHILTLWFSKVFQIQILHFLNLKIQIQILQKCI